MYKENADAAGISLISSWNTKISVRSFSGIVYLDSAIVIGQAGFDCYSTSNEIIKDSLWDGRFSYFEQKERNACAFTDYMGQDIIFFYRSEEHWAASNSFLFLAEFLAAKGVKLTVRAPSLVAPLYPNSFTQQLISDRTGIAEIRMLPAHQKIEVVNGNFRVINRINPIPSKIGKSEYRDVLIQYAEKWVARTHALLAEFPNTTKVDITGGRDSRLILALICAGHDDLSNINFSSNKAQAEDFKVAQSLSTRLGFEIRNPKIPIARASNEAMLDLWKYGNLGIYYPVYFAGSTQPASTLHFHGAGGGCLREVYGDNLVNAVMQKVPASDMVRSRLRNELRTALKLWGLDDLQDPMAWTVHYRNSRSRLHFGRNWFRNLFSTLITPIASWDLVRAVSAYDKEELARAQIYCDLMLLCKPELAYAPFDTPEKSFSSEAIAASPFVENRPSLKRLIGTISIYRGQPEAIPKSQDISLSDHKQLLGRELRFNKSFAKSLNIIAPRYFVDAENALSSTQSLTKSGTKAAHIIAVGEIVKLCS
ncbi:hypothetical protein [Advenella kashmirensis]|nr:hypothetical protein [Advenella kashmirensis]